VTGLRSLAAAVTGAWAARDALRRVRALPAAETLARTNFRGRPVTLAGGPALAAGASVAAAAGAGTAACAAAALTAGLGAGAVGLYDDVVGARPDQKADKGFRGHLVALRDRRVTSGLVKIAGVGAAGLAAAALLAADPRRPRRPRRPVTAVADVLLGAGVIAGTANLLNLLDLRPGRALKAGVLLGTPLAGGPHGGLAAGPVGAAVGLLPGDLREDIMLGDSGANALGALLGVALAARTGPVGRAAILAVVAGLTATSERVSFTAVIARTDWLRRVDELGRRRA
jgi:UDP-N-acetylmuramyl pentapeptide phosphotransferase/UDP-N-acetylglucosamine-1-phosphate transferase